MQGSFISILFPVMDRVAYEGIYYPLAPLWGKGARRAGKGSFMFLLISIITLLCPQDTTFRETTIDEVVVSSSQGTGKKAVSKGRVASIDEHLAQLSKVEMVRRGNYAWEPVVNNMATERVSTTIDGMKIFYACTDKMDPVTSYVESSNLQRISLNSGLDGNPQATGNIGGSIDLKLRRIGFDAQPSEI